MSKLTQIIALELAMCLAAEPVIGAMSHGQWVLRHALPVAPSLFLSQAIPPAPNFFLKTLEVFRKVLVYRRVSPVPSMSPEFDLYRTSVDQARRSYTGGHFDVAQAHVDRLQMELAAFMSKKVIPFEVVSISRDAAALQKDLLRAVQIVGIYKEMRDADGSGLYDMHRLKPLLKSLSDEQLGIVTQSVLNLFWSDFQPLRSRWHGHVGIPMDGTELVEAVGQLENEWRRRNPSHPLQEEVGELHWILFNMLDTVIAQQGIRNVQLRRPGIAGSVISQDPDIALGISPWLEEGVRALAYHLLLFDPMIAHGAWVYCGLNILFIAAHAWRYWDSNKPWWQNLWDTTWAATLTTLISVFPVALSAPAFLAGIFSGALHLGVNFWALNHGFIAGSLAGVIDISQDSELLPPILRRRAAGDEKTRDALVALFESARHVRVKKPDFTSRLHLDSSLKIFNSVPRGTYSARDGSYTIPPFRFRALRFHTLAENTRYHLQAEWREGHGLILIFRCKDETVIYSVQDYLDAANQWADENPSAREIARGRTPKLAHQAMDSYFLALPENEKKQAAENAFKTLLAELKDIHPSVRRADQKADPTIRSFNEKNHVVWPKTRNQTSFQCSPLPMHQVEVQFLKPGGYRLWAQWVPRHGLVVYFIGTTEIIPYYADQFRLDAAKDRQTITTPIKIGTALNLDNAKRLVRHEFFSRELEELIRLWLPVDPHINAKSPEKKQLNIANQLFRQRYPYVTCTESGLLYLTPIDGHPLVLAGLGIRNGEQSKKDRVQPAHYSPSLEWIDGYGPALLLIHPTHTAIVGLKKYREHITKKDMKESYLTMQRYTSLELAREGFKNFVAQEPLRKNASETKDAIRELLKAFVSLPRNNDSAVAAFKKKIAIFTEKQWILNQEEQSLILKISNQKSAHLTGVPPREPLRVVPEWIDGHGLVVFLIGTREILGYDAVWFRDHEPTSENQLRVPVRSEVQLKIGEDTMKEALFKARSRMHIIMRVRRLMHIKPKEMDAEQKYIANFNAAGFRVTSASKGIQISPDPGHMLVFGRSLKPYTDYVARLDAQSRVLTWNNKNQRHPFDLSKYQQACQRPETNKTYVSLVTKYMQRTEATAAVAGLHRQEENAWGEFNTAVRNGTTSEIQRLGLDVIPPLETEFYIRKAIVEAFKTARLSKDVASVGATQVVDWIFNAIVRNMTTDHGKVYVKKGTAFSLEDITSEQETFLRELFKAWLWEAQTESGESLQQFLIRAAEAGVGAAIEEMPELAELMTRITELHREHNRRVFDEEPGMADQPLATATPKPPLSNPAWWAKLHAASRAELHGVGLSRRVVDELLPLVRNIKYTNFDSLLAALSSDAATILVKKLELYGDNWEVAGYRPLRDLEIVERSRAEPLSPQAELEPAPNKPADTETSATAEKERHQAQIFRNAIAATEGFDTQTEKELEKIDGIVLKRWQGSLWQEYQDLVSRSGSKWLAVRMIALHPDDHQERIDALKPTSPEPVHPQRQKRAPTPPPAKRMLGLSTLEKVTTRRGTPITRGRIRIAIRKRLLEPDVVDSEKGTPLFNENRVDSIIAQMNGRDLWAPGGLVRHALEGIGTIQADKAQSDLRPNRSEVKVAFQNGSVRWVPILELRRLMGAYPLWNIIGDALPGWSRSMFEHAIYSGQLSCDYQAPGQPTRYFDVARMPAMVIGLTQPPEEAWERFTRVMHDDYGAGEVLGGDVSATGGEETRVQFKDGAIRTVPRGSLRELLSADALFTEIRKRTKEFSPDELFWAIRNEILPYEVATGEPGKRHRFYDSGQIDYFQAVLAMQRGMYAPDNYVHHERFGVGIIIGSRFSLGSVKEGSRSLTIKWVKTDPKKTPPPVEVPVSEIRRLYSVREMTLAIITLKKSLTYEPTRLRILERNFIPDFATQAEDYFLESRVKAMKEAISESPTHLAVHSWIVHSRYGPGIVEPRGRSKDKPDHIKIRFWKRARHVAIADLRPIVSFIDLALLSGITKTMLIFLSKVNPIPPLYQQPIHKGDLYFDSGWVAVIREIMQTHRFRTSHEPRPDLLEKAQVFWPDEYTPLMFQRFKGIVRRIPGREERKAA